MHFRRFSQLVVALSLSAPSTQLVASALPPDITASASANGRFLVLTEREFDNPYPNVIRRVVRTSYEVLETEPFLNEKDHLRAAGHFWSASAMSWRFTLEPGYMRTQFWPLVSNDGKYVVLIGVIPPIVGLPVLQIYQKKDYEGVLVRSFQIGDISPRESVKGFTDASPQWFVGGTLSFSADGRQLIFARPGEESVVITLQDGSISRAR